MLLWDAAMAHAIATALSATPTRLVVHVCGSDHCAGIVEMLRHYRAAARPLVISMHPEEDCRTWVRERHGGPAHSFVVLTDAAWDRR
eukprot:706339-Prymnesium_polylepis.1